MDLDEYESLTKTYLSMNSKEMFALVLDQFDNMIVSTEDKPEVRAIINEFIPGTLMADGVFSDGEKRFVSNLRQQAPIRPSLKQVVDNLSKYKFSRERFDGAIESFKGLDKESQDLILKLIIAICSVDGRCNKQEDEWMRSLVEFSK